MSIEVPYAYMSVGEAAERAAHARFQGRFPSPDLVARSEGRTYVTRGEIETWADRLEIPYGEARGEIKLPVRGETEASTVGRLRSFEPGSARHASAASPQRTYQVPKLLEEPTGFEIALGGQAGPAMEEHIREAMWRFGSRATESGGWLYARYLPDDERVMVVHASGPGPDARHGVGSVGLSEPAKVEAELEEVVARAGLTRIGDWHSHPVRDPIPSAADLAAWGLHSADADVLPYAAVIVMPVEHSGWMAPTVAGWVTYEDENGVLVTAPAKVTGW